MDDDMFVVVRDGHPLLARSRLRIADIEGAQWLLPRAGVSVRRSIEGRLAEAGLGPPQVAVEVSSTSALVTELLRHSDLLSVMSESMLSGSAGRGLSALPMADARFSRKVGIVIRRHEALPLLARRFVEVVQELMRA